MLTHGLIFDRDKLIDVRTRSHLTQEQLAYMIGVPRSTVVGWEREGKCPSGQAILRIMVLLRLDPEDLLTEVDQ